MDPQACNVQVLTLTSTGYSVAGTYRAGQQIISEVFDIRIELDTVLSREL